MKSKRTLAEAGCDQLVLNAEESALVKRALDPNSPFGKRKRFTPEIDNRMDANLINAARFIAEFGNIGGPPEELLRVRPTEGELYDARMRCQRLLDEAFATISKHHGMQVAEAIPEIDVKLNHEGLYYTLPSGTILHEPFPSGALKSKETFDGMQSRLMQRLVEHEAKIKEQLPEPLDITAPSDWDDYDKYLLAGGKLEYKAWHESASLRYWRMR